MTNISFIYEGLKVDYLSFNFQFNDKQRIKQIAAYLVETFHCSSTLFDQSNKKRQLLVENNQNYYSAEFVIHSNKHWRGTTLRFKGNHAQLFYKDLKSQKLDWSIFNLECTNLGRVDLCYDRKLKKDDGDINIFLGNCYRQLNNKNNNRSAKIADNILRVGKRSSSNFFRVYLKPNGRELRFEIELKKTVVKKFQHYLFTNQIKAFEELVTIHFYNQSIQLFDIESSYTDWLLANFRRVRKPPVKEVYLSSLSTSYMTDKFMHDLVKVESFYKLVQLLNYIKSLENSCKSISMGDRTYIIFQFPVNHLLKFMGKSKNNHYQIKKLVEFLKSLQTIEPIVENFSNGGFRSYIAFPYIKVVRKESWWVELSVCQELFSYRYPFHFPKTFLNYQNNSELKVQFGLLQSFCNISIYKEFRTQEFLEQVSVSNSKSAQLKKCIVKVLHELKNSKIIEPKFQILTKQNIFKEVTALTPNLVSRSKSIFYIENINSNLF